MNALTNTPSGDAAPSRQVREMNVDDGQGAEVFYGARLDPSRLISIFRAHWWLFALVAAVIFLLAVAYTAVAPRMYTGTASVVLEAPAKPGPNGEMQPAQPADSATVDTEVQLVQSRDIADQVVTALKLDQDPTFWAGSHKQAPVDLDRRHDAAVGVVQGGLKAKRAGLTSVITIAFTSRSPALAARVANGYADQYLIAQSQAKLNSTKQSGAALNDKLDSLRKAALSDAAALAQYRTAHGLYTDQGAALTEQEATAYNEQLAQAQADYTGDMARLNVAKSQLSHEDASGAAKGVAVDSPVLQNLRAQRSQLTATIAQLENRYGARYPDVIASQKQLDDVNAGIQAEVRRIVSDLQTRVEVSRQRVSSMQQALGSARGRLAGGTTASVTLDELQRKADASKQVYQDYLARYQQASASVGTEQPDARITNRADAPDKPSSPNVPLNLALGFIVAVGAGVGAVYTREALHSGLSTGEDIEQRLGLPHLGSVPELGSVADKADRGVSPPDYLLAKPLSAFGEAVRGLRTSLKFAGGNGQGARIVAMTSALPSEGKSTTSLCLARSAGQSGARVLLVDCDLRRRSINKLLGVEPQVGLLEVLNGQAELKDVIFRDEPSGAYILPLANSTTSPEEVFETAAMNKLLRDVGSEFDLVFLDTAPVLAVAETRVLAAKSDAVVFLAHWRKTPEKAIIAALKLLDAAGAPVAGVALTQVNMLQQARYGYGDATYYYADYKKYYNADA
jgi:polysaccharide biosynthesis transport protein